MYMLEICLKNGQFNPFNHKISVVILPCVYHTVLMMLVQRIWCWSAYYPLIDIFLSSHHLHITFCKVYVYVPCIYQDGTFWQVFCMLLQCQPVKKKQIVITMYMTISNHFQQIW